MLKLIKRLFGTKEVELPSLADIVAEEAPGQKEFEARMRAKHERPQEPDEE